MFTLDFEFEYAYAQNGGLRGRTPQKMDIGLGPISKSPQKMDCSSQNVTKFGSVLQCKSDFFASKMQNFLDFVFYRRVLPHFKKHRKSDSQKTGRLRRSHKKKSPAAHLTKKKVSESPLCELFGPGKVQYTLVAPRGAAQRAAGEFCDFFVFCRWACTGNVQFR